MALGKLEGRITVPSGNWTLILNETGGSSGTVTIDADTYYLSTDTNGVYSFASRLETSLNAVGSATYTVAVDPTTGQCTISTPGGFVTAFDLTWVDTEVQDILGFSQGNLSGALSYTGDAACRFLWVPQRKPLTLSGMQGFRGTHELDLHQLESPSGDVYSLAGERKVVLKMRFEAVKGCRTLVHQEVIENESFERFYLDCIYGAGPGGTPGGPVRWHYDETDDATFGTYYVVGMQNWGPESVQEGWAGRFTIDLPRLVQLRSEVSS